MALSLVTKSKTEIERQYYVAYFRESGTAIASTDYDTSEHWATFLALFDDLGEFEDKSLKLNTAEGDTIDASDGVKKVLGYVGTFEVRYLQNTVLADAGIQDLLTKEVDLLLVCDDSEKAYYIHNIVISGEKQEVSGDVGGWLLKNEKKVTTPSGYYTCVAIPQPA